MKQCAPQISRGREQPCKLAVGYRAIAKFIHPAIMKSIAPENVIDTHRRYAPLYDKLFGAVLED
jgi:hypothetical protein